VICLVEGLARLTGARPRGRTGARPVSVSTASLGATPLRLGQPRPRAPAARPARAVILVARGRAGRRRAAAASVPTPPAGSARSAARWPVRCTNAG